MTESVEKLRTIVNVHEANFKPYGLQGREQTELTWVNISYDPDKGQGSFLIRFEPGAKSIAHEHTGYEEFLVLEGNIIDSDGTEYKTGDFVSLKPGSRHESHSPDGLLAIVTLRGGTGNRTLEPGEEINIL